jgi:DNA-binding NtrC family response regulator
VRGTSGAEHEAARWADTETGPIAIADGGTLFIQDAQALPAEIQDDIARQLIRKIAAAGAGAVPTTGLVVSIRQPSTGLSAVRRLARPLAQLVGDAVTLPTLADRGEDLRALILDHLAAAGTRRRGEPLGVDPRALQLLLDHGWPGNDAELTDVLSRASEEARGPVVTPADLAAIGFRPLGDGPMPAAPEPAPQRRRPRPRATPRRR